MTRLIIIGALLLLTGATARAEETTSVRNGTNSATVTQSGGPGDTQKFIERAPGQTRIEQRSGTNSAVITQDSGDKAAGSIPDDLDDTMPAPPPRADAAPRTEATPDDLLDDGPVTKSKAGIDVYGVVRDKSSPQGRANLDRLMTILGGSAKTK